MLAIVLATFGASQPMHIAGFSVGAEVVAIGGAALYGVLALTVGNKLLAGLGRGAERDGGVSQPMMAVVL